MTKRRLSGKVAIVTGAGRGIGRCIALRFAREGSGVVVVSRSRREIDAVAKEASRYKAGALAIAGDVSKPGNAQKVIEKTLARFERVDILVNNAGIRGPRGFITEISVDDWDATIDTNLKGMFLCSQAVLPQMIKQRSGNIINITSGAGRKTKHDSFVSPARSLVYSVSKFGVEGFTLALAAQVHEFCINANALGPGPTNTQMHRDDPADRKEHLRNPEDIEEVAVFLATQGPMGLTGESIDAATWDKIYRNRLAQIGTTSSA